MTNVILCGGSGTRLWPLSRALLPKQFVKIFDNDSLFSKTLKRNTFAENRIIICNESHYFLALDECGGNSAKFILEPFGKNTAAPIVFCALSVDKDEILLVTPSDHLIELEDEYNRSIKAAVELANDGKLVTFGITPNEPNIGYGYIKADGNNVKSFIEKPSLKKAKELLAQGDCYFNSGMFCFKAGVFIDQMQKYAPNILEQARQAILNVENNSDIMRIKPQYMQNIDDISIDYALMQKSENIAMVPLNARWSDMGSFDELSKKVQSSPSTSIDANNNFVISYKNSALVDVDDLIIVDTKDALLVTKKGSSQKVKNVYNLIKKTNPNLCEIHTKAYRPWGSYEVLEDAPNFKIKKIIVKPYKRLSLQKHLHRSEHWVVVSGEALVTIDYKETLLKNNQSIYIEKQKLHRLENKLDTDLILIEVQVGDYLGDDDIIRIEDDYSRT